MDMQNKHRWTQRIKRKNIYLAKVKFEDGFDKKIGTNKKTRPVLVIDKFFNDKLNKSMYIIAPIYSVKNHKNYKYHCSINEWTNSFNKNNDYYNAKFKVSQIQTIDKKEFIKNIKKGVFFYKEISCNSPIASNDLNKLNSEIKKYYNEQKYKNNTINLYLRRMEKDKRKLFQKELEKEI